MKRVYLESNENNIADLINMQISEHIWASPKLTTYLYLKLDTLHVGNWGLNYLGEDDYVVDIDTVRVLALLPNAVARITYIRSLK